MRHAGNETRRRTFLGEQAREEFADVYEEGNRPGYGREDYEKMQRLGRRGYEKGQEGYEGKEVTLTDNVNMKNLPGMRGAVREKLHLIYRSLGMKLLQCWGRQL